MTLFCSALSVNTASAERMPRDPKDILVFASSVAPTGFDPAIANDYDSSNIVTNIYEGLLKFDNNSTKLVGALAESYTVSKDGLTYTFKLRHGVKFHDGTDFNAEAVKFNFDRQMPENRTPNMAYAPVIFDVVKSIDVIDDYTISITLKEVSKPFTRNLAMVFGAPIASPKALKENNNNIMDKPVGTGPYKLFHWDRGASTVLLTTFDDYWGKKPPVKGYIYKVIQDNAARVVALNNGEVDIINGIDATTIPAIKEGGNLIYEAQGNNINFMVFNCREGYPTRDVEVRRAIAQAIDVPKLVKSLYKEFATPAHSFLPSLLEGYSDDTKGVAYNLEKAKNVLARKGIKELKIITYYGARPYNSVGGQVLAESIQDYLSRAGINATIKVYDWATYRTKLLTEDWDLAFMGRIGINADPDNMLNIFASTDPVNNTGMWNSPRFNELISTGLKAPTKERASIYQRADQLLVSEMVVLPISHAKTLLGYRKNIDGYLQHPLGSTRAYEITKN